MVIDLMGGGGGRGGHQSSLMEDKNLSEQTRLESQSSVQTKLHIAGYTEINSKSHRLNL